MQPPRGRHRKRASREPVLRVVAAWESRPDNATDADAKTRVGDNLRWDELVDVLDRSANDPIRLVSSLAWHRDRCVGFHHVRPGRRRLRLLGGSGGVHLVVLLAVALLAPVSLFLQAQSWGAVETSREPLTTHHPNARIEHWSQSTCWIP